jgi:alkylation response protein AidB-like acyl-CoA dehydrogenase
MDFSTSERVKSFQGLVRDFMRKEVHPLEQRFRHGGFAAILPELRLVRVKARETGLFAAHMPPEYGGAHLPLTEFAHLSEELGKSTAPRSRRSAGWGPSPAGRSAAASP